ncbi:hypothetical protein QOZ80_3BG0271720 [Eleusine coracana subsp. coracana]|nr:hypothetical protein QOZ80_3BG0271720 [Eleusine coracana subsp. coracana]
MEVQVRCLMLDIPCPHEEECLRRCMQNSARLEQLGIPGLTDYLARAHGVSKEKNKTNRRSTEDSESDYDPSQDDTAEQDLVHDDVTEGSKGNNTKKTSEDNSDASAGVKFRSHCFDQHLDNAMAGSTAVITQLAGYNHMTNEGDEVEWNRGVNMGHGLETHHGKLPVVIPEGHIRPLVPITATKYATECNIAVRSHVLVLTHWKEYKNNKVVIALYLGTLREVCQKNKDNRGKVKFHQKTSSCSYPVFVENLTEIENRLAAQPTEGEEPKSDVQVVSKVLDQNTKKNLFLQNVGIQTAPPPRLSARDVATQLEAEKVENGELWKIISNQSKQMDEMSKKQAELEAKLELLLGRN